MGRTPKRKMTEFVALWMPRGTLIRISGAAAMMSARYQGIVWSRSAVIRSALAIGLEQIEKYGAAASVEAISRPRPNEPTSLEMSPNLVAQEILAATATKNYIKNYIEIDADDPDRDEYVEL